MGLLSGYPDDLKLLYMDITIADIGQSAMTPGCKIYQQPLKITDQIDILLSFWPQLKADFALKYAAKLERVKSLQGFRYSEGLVVLIRESFFSNKLTEELAEVLTMITYARHGRFCDFLGVSGPGQLRDTFSAQRLQRFLEDQQKGDLLVVPAQLGLNYRGEAVKKSLPSVSEVHMGKIAKKSSSCRTAFEHPVSLRNAAVMLLANPHRFVGYQDLFMYASGSQFAPAGDTSFSMTPCFQYIAGGFQLSYRLANKTNPNYGIASIYADL